MWEEVDKGAEIANEMMEREYAESEFQRLMAEPDVASPNYEVGAAPPRIYSILFL